MRRFYMLDTNVVSELIKPVPDSKVMKKIDENTELCTISSISWMEMLYGMNKTESPVKQEKLRTFYTDVIQGVFPILELDSNCSLIAADIFSRMEKIGHTVPFADCLIAATSVSKGMILVTRNIKDFEPMQQITPLLLENWFE